MDITASGLKLSGVDGICVILGKNGAGKSTILKAVDSAGESSTPLNIKYITPERGGVLKYQPNVETNIIQSVGWLKTTRRSNQFNQFREQTMVQYRRLETLALREIEKNPAIRKNFNHTFDSEIAKINGLLDEIEIKRGEADFSIYQKGTTQQITPEAISSGEAELISLGIELLVFASEQVDGKSNLLLLDEPDVHLHPDLQARLAHFIGSLVLEKKFVVLIATHSTAFLGAFQEQDVVRVVFMSKGQKEFIFRPVSEIQKRILPVFGAHPLSNLFNEAPVLLLEGEDDERIWQKAVRSSRGTLRLFPVAVEGVSNLDDYEKEVISILRSVYDSPIGYSLRDRDGAPEEINDTLPIARMRLSCRAAENLILSDDVLSSLSVTWEEVTNRIEHWLQQNATHPHYVAMKAFSEGGLDRKNGDIKAIRNDLMGLIGSERPWEVAVGQVIPNLRKSEGPLPPNSLAAYLGAKVMHNLLRIAD